MKQRCMWAGVLVMIVLLFVGCPEPTVTYEIGDYVPGGGIVFYDKGSVTNGWRYLAVASMDLPFVPYWGPGAISTGATEQVIGTGAANTALIVSVYGSGTYAAVYCADDISRGSEDWYLPSLDELLLCYTNLKMNGIGDLNDGYYWSSSENDADTAVAVNFTDGSWLALDKGNPRRVRSVRAFP